jgi:predicted TIM-barrel fold metal-dependent hydrolase
MQTRWGDLPVADGHVHFFSHRFFELLGGQSIGLSAMEARLGWTMPPSDPAELARAWAAELDRHGVSKAALIASIPGDESSVLAAAAACPERFYAYAMVNPAAPGAAVAPGLNAICLFPAMHRYSLHDPRVEPLLEQAATLGCAVFVHCGVLTVGIRQKLGLPSPFDMRFSNPLDLHAIALRFPKVRFVVPHFGAGYFREALMLASLCPNVYLDTSSSNSWMRYEGLDLKTVFRRALDVVGPERLIFGTDSSFFPRGWVAPVFEAQLKVLEELDVPVANTRLVLFENIQRLLS